MKPLFAVTTDYEDVATFVARDDADRYALAHAPATIWHWDELAGVQGRFVDPNPGTRPIGRTEPAKFIEYPPRSFLATTAA